MGSPQNLPVGAILLCAKADEKTVITGVVPKYFTRTQSVAGGYPTFKLPAEDAGMEENLILADCGEMANVSSASRTGYLLAKFNPGLIIFLGTAGSLKPEQCQVGDVVVPTLGVVTKYYDKLEDAGRGIFGFGVERPNNVADLGALTRDRHKYLLRKQERNLDLTGEGRAYISEAASNRTGGNTLASGLKKFVATSRSPEVHKDTMIFSWDMVLGSEHYRSLLERQINSKAFAVDMESYGFLSAVEQFQAPPVERAISSIVVRGISDICGDKRSSGSDGRNEVATENAAHVACRIIRDGYLVR